MTVYLIRHSGDNAVKIGYTDGDPVDRLSSLQTASASVLELVTTIPDAPRQVEQALHAKFADLRVRPNGEWFRDDAVIHGAFKEHRAANHRDHLVAQVGEVLATLSEAFSGGEAPSAGRLEQVIRDVRQLTGVQSCVCTTVLEEVVKESSSAAQVQAFWESFCSKFVWDLLPFSFLFDLYVAWRANMSSSNSWISRQHFKKDLLRVIENDARWHCLDKGRKFRPGTMMDATETLIAEYELATWFNPIEKTYSRPDADLLSKPRLAASYAGILRAKRD